LKRHLTWIATALAVVSVVLIVVVLRGEESGSAIELCNVSGAPHCRVTAPPCNAASLGDRNEGNQTVARRMASALRKPDRVLPYGFNDAAPLNGQLTPGQDIALHREAGSSLIRIVIDWGAIESTPNQFDFSTPDRIYCAAAAGGIGVLFTMTGIPPWAVPSGSSCDAVPCVQAPDPEYLPAFRRFAEIAAVRYPHVVAFEAWNEPNLPIFWPSPDPLRYVEFLQAMYEGVKDGSPRTTVLGGAVANSDTDGNPPGSLSLSTFLEDMLQAGAAQYMDALSIHAYPIGAIGSEDDEFTPQLSETRRILESAGNGEMSLWITETGVTTAPGAFSPQFSPEQQATELNAMYEAASADPLIPLIVFHTLLDPNESVPGGPGFGWFTRSADSAVPKPVVCLFREISNLPGCDPVPLR